MVAEAIRIKFNSWVFDILIGVKLNDALRIASLNYFNRNRWRWQVRWRLKLYKMEEPFQYLKSRRMWKSIRKLEVKLEYV